MKRREHLRGSPRGAATLTDVQTKPSSSPDLLASAVDTVEFHRSSGFSRWLRRRLESAIIPRSAPENRTAYRAQFGDASRNVEIAVEGLGRLIRRHPVKSALVLRTLADWLTGYFGMQRRLADRPRYLIYTQHDAEIPFVPEADILYTYMISQIVYVANALANICSARQMHHITGGFVVLNELGVEAFDRCPSVMPRFHGHQRLSLKVIQRLDQPLNCCPSLHIAYSLFLDGVAETFIKPLRQQRDVFDSVRYSTVGMFNSVLYTKQHSILDVAFGMVCAKLVFERRFDRPFNAFVDQFPALQDAHPIPYDEIVSIYEEALQLHRRCGSFAGTLDAYLEAHGYQTVAPDADIGHSHFDTVRREIVRKVE